MFKQWHVQRFQSQNSSLSAPAVTSLHKVWFLRLQSCLIHHHEWRSWMNTHHHVDCTNRVLLQIHYVSYVHFGYHGLCLWETVSLPMSFSNSWIWRFTYHVTFCFDILGHRASYFLIEFINLGRVPMCEGEFSNAHNRAMFSKQRFVLARPHLDFFTQSSNVLCPWNRVSITWCLLQNPPN